MGLRFLGIIFSSIFAFGGGLIGYSLEPLYLNLQYFNAKGLEVNDQFRIFYLILFTTLGIFIGLLIGSYLFRQIVTVGTNLRRIPLADKIAASLGTIISISVAFALGKIIMLMSSFVSAPAIFAIILMETVLLVWLGNVVAFSIKDELRAHMPGSFDVAVPESVRGIPKILDTNVIIDGRIYDICRTGFIEGQVILPGFVIEELQHIADSADSLRRNRGRRGLDILHQMQNEDHISIRIMDRYNKANFAPGDPVDMKLVKLAKSQEAYIVTNDFNLNKVAKIHGVRVLNINELANAVKPVVLPGEELTVNIVREGKEYNQGVGYLDDGTMVVVENGKRYIGETLPVSVSSVLQTVAGKMIFGEIKTGDGDSSEGNNSEENGNGSGGTRRVSR
ncbi:MAG: PIN domain-containing protein [bacterium]